MNHRDLLTELAQQEPTFVRVWLETIWAQHPEAAKGFNWLGLFEIATFNATRAATVSKQESLAWANAARSLYLLLNDHKERRAQSILAKLMSMRVTLIVKFGAVPHHDILDTGDIADWFYGELDMPYADAVYEAARWPQKLDLDVMRKLRNIKTRLSIIERLTTHGWLPISDELCAWLALKPNLP
jgi:hypothetical protein